MAIAQELLSGVKSESAKAFVSLLCDREAEAVELRQRWMAEIAAQRQRREGKKHLPSKRENATVASYAKDAEDIIRDLAEGMKEDSDEKKIGFILFSEMEAFISDEDFWSDLLSGPPRAALKRIQRFRLETIDLIRGYGDIDISLAGSKEAEFERVRSGYQKNEK